MSKKLIYLISFVLLLGVAGNASAWFNQDVGDPNLSGSASHSAGIWTVVGDGADIWGGSDQFHYVYCPLSGDGVITVRIVSMDVTADLAKAGVMIRETLDAGSKHAMMAMTGTEGAQFVWRSNTAGGSSGSTTAGPTPPWWLRIDRIGDQLRGYHSADGTMWVLQNTMTIPMNTNVYIGMAVTSQNSNQLCTAVFDNLYATVDCTAASNPNPPDGATCVPLDVVLSWSPGCGAVLHDVYFGTDPAALYFAGKYMDESYAPPGPLEPDTTYYWRIDEFCPDGEVTGEVWEFTTWCPPHIKWVQPPDETPTGMNIRIDRSDITQRIERILADDFECTTTGPITDVHFWGSWKGDPEPRDYIHRIHLSIHKDIPSDPTKPVNYSMPGYLLWEMDFDSGEFTETLCADLSPEYEWWWDPYRSPEWADPNGDQKIYRYDIHIDPNVAFIQEGSVDDPVIYWLDIYVLTEFGEFGWKTSKIHWNDDAVYKAMPGVSPPWSELRYPPQHPYTPESIDMAFMIATKPIVEPDEACCFPDGTCLELTPAECIEKGGWPQGPGTDCTSTDCPVPEPTEACCLPDGNCADLTLAECLALGGTPQGSGTDCTDVNCPPPCDLEPEVCPTGDISVVITYWAGSNDNFASPPEPASPDTILWDFITTCSPLNHIPLQFDQVPGEGGVPANSWLGHTFSGLPSGIPLGIVAAKLQIRARATTGGGKGGTYNDHISIVESIAGCMPTWAWQNRFENLPEAGGDWLSGEVATFCLDLAALPRTTGGPVSVLDQLASGSLSIRIDDDTGLDYMKLTIAVCPCEYRYPSKVLAGAGDCNFPMPSKPASPRPELFTAFPPGSWRKFGQIVPDKRFGHTFTELPSEIVAAELEICLRAGRDIPIDDELHLEFLNNPTPTFAWGKTIKDLPLTPGGTPIGSWDEGDIATFTLDLANLLPSAAGVTGVLGKLEDGNLDVYIKDDTAVGYIILRYWRCCEITVPGDINIDGIINFKDVGILASHWLEVDPLSGF